MNDGNTPRLLADAYGFGAVITCAPAARGAAGEIFKLVVAEGTYAAKEFITQIPDASELARQVAFASACLATGVPNPETVPTADGALLFWHPETGRPWLVQRWADGTPPDRTDRPVSLWLARQAATIHRLARPGHPAQQIPFFYIRATSEWAQTADAARHAGMEWAQRLEERIPEFERLAALVNAVPVGDVVTCHRDLKATNTLLADSGNRWLLDWDTSGPQEPWRELGTLLLHHVSHHDALTAIAAAYRRAGGNPWPNDADLFATGLAVWLNFLDGQITCALDPTIDARHRTRAASTAASLVHGIPGLDTLTTAARAVSGAR